MTTRSGSIYEEAFPTIGIFDTQVREIIKRTSSPPNFRGFFEKSRKPFLFQSLEAFRLITQTTGFSI